MAANTIVRYVRTDVQAGGTGETNNDTGTDRAFSRLAEAAAALDWDFTINDDEVEVRCSSPTGVQDDSVPAFNGCVTGPSNRIKIIGDWSGDTENSNEYVKTTNSNHGLYLAEGYVDVQNVQFYTEQNNHLIRIECSENSHIRISRCIFHAHDTSSYSYAGISIVNDTGYTHEVDVWNSTFYGTATSGQSNRSGIHAYETLLVLYNTICYGFYGYGIRYGSGSTCLLKNTVVHDVVDSTSFSSFETGSDYNAFDEGSAPGANSIDTTSYAVTDIWTDPDNGDFSIPDTDSPVYDIGTDLTSDPQGKISFSDDIAGNIRAQWSMGSREYLVAGGISESISVIMDSGISLMTALNTTAEAFSAPGVEIGRVVSSPIGIRIEPGVYVDGGLTGQCQVAIEPVADGIGSIAIPVSPMAEAEIVISFVGGIAESIALTVVPGLDADHAIIAPVNLATGHSINQGMTIIVPIAVTGSVGIDIRYLSEFVLTEILSVVSTITLNVSNDSPITTVVAGRSPITILIQEDSLI